jgi:hypothetical protein
MRKLLLAFSILFFYYLSAQNDSSVISSELFTIVPDSLKIPIDNRISYRYPNWNYENRNIKLTQIKNKVLRDSLDDNGSLVSRTECTISVYPYYFTMGGTYILKSQTSGDILGQNTTYPGDIVTYRFQIVKNGKYIEYYSDGNKKAKGRYWGSVKIGKWKYYYPNGTNYKTEKYLKPWKLKWDNKKYNHRNAKLINKSTN